MWDPRVTKAEKVINFHIFFHTPGTNVTDINIPIHEVEAKQPCNRLLANYLETNDNKSNDVVS